MKEYTIVYKNGTTEKFNCTEKKELIKVKFEGSEVIFKEKVERLIWSTPAMHYVEDVASGNIESEITSADVNPYGWRNN